MFRLLCLTALSFVCFTVAADEDLGGQVLALFTAKCSQCHGSNSPAMGGFNKILDFKFLRDSNYYVLAGKPGDSEVFRRIDSDSMPYGGPALAKGEKNLVKKWIANGAPDAIQSPNQAFSLDQVLAAARDQIKAAPASRRDNLRVVVFSPDFSGSAEGKARTTAALTKVLNSLSSEKLVYRPDNVTNFEGIAFVIDIRKLGWDANLWESTIEGDDPFFLNSDVGKEIVDLTGTQKPVIFGEWFISHATREPLYSNILQRNDRLQDLETSLGIDRIKNIQNFKVARAGFVNSGVSKHNRVIERHPIPRSSRAYWLSYDFRSSEDDSDILNHPFGPADSGFSNAFVHAGGEVIYHLPNGFLGFMVANSAGQRLAEAPTDIVVDIDPRRPAIATSVSCFSCHASGFRRNDDIIRDNVLNSRSFSADEKVLATKLYPEKAAFQALMDADNNLFHQALSQAGLNQIAPEADPINAIAFGYDSRIDVDSAAVYLNFDSRSLIAALEHSSGLEDIVDKLKLGVLTRESFESRFAAMVDAIREYRVFLKRPQALSAGGSHVCAIRGTSVLCWGGNEFGQSQAPENLGVLDSIAAGFSHTCIVADQKVVCWGDNSQGQAQVPANLAPASAVFAGGAHTCALTTGGPVCWGRSSEGQLVLPKPVRTGQVSKMALGEAHTCALVDEAVFCWGANNLQQTQVPKMNGPVLDISAGKNHTCAITQTQVYCWGANTFGQCNAPQVDQPLSQISAGHTHSCVRHGDPGSVDCWGTFSGQPQFPEASKDVAAGKDFTCSIAFDGVECWGVNSQGQLQVPPALQIHEGPQQ